VPILVKGTEPGHVGLTHHIVRVIVGFSTRPSRLTHPTPSPWSPSHHGDKHKVGDQTARPKGGGRTSESEREKETCGDISMFSCHV